MYDDDALLPISGLQHLLFCERQCALIHVERIWAENALTIEGRHIHERVDEGGSSIGRGFRVLRGATLRSRALGLVGKADVVEIRDDGRPSVCPIEYKRGPRRAWLHDDVQLCAQAIALEEMLGVGVPAGVVYHGRSRRRRDVVIDGELRERTRAATNRFHALVSARVTPRASRQKKCTSCEETAGS